MTAMLKGSPLLFNAILLCKGNEINKLIFFINDSTRLRAGGVRRRRRKKIKLRLNLLLQKLAPLARCVYRKDGQQRNT
jgi:hypothetical protein